MDSDLSSAEWDMDHVSHLPAGALTPELRSAGKCLSISPAEATPQQNTQMLIDAQVDIQFSLQLHKCPDTEL